MVFKTCVDVTAVKSLMNSEKAISVQLLLFRAIQSESAFSNRFISAPAMALINTQCQIWDWISCIFSFCLNSTVVPCS